MLNGNAGINYIPGLLELRLIMKFICRNELAYREAGEGRDQEADTLLANSVIDKQQFRGLDRPYNRFGSNYSRCPYICLSTFDFIRSLDIRNSFRTKFSKSNFNLGRCMTTQRRVSFRLHRIRLYRESPCIRS